MRRFLLGVLLAAAGVFITPAAAWAHAELLSSTPGYGERLTAAPAELRLEFSGAMDLTGSRLTLQHKGGKAEALAHPALPTPDRRVVAVPLPPRLGDGAYSLVWYFLGNDGHLMGGEVSFEVGTAAASTPAVAGSAGPAAQTGPKAKVRSLGPGIAGPAVDLEASNAAQAATPKRARFTVAVATPQAAVRFLDYTCLAVLIGGGFFLALVWRDGTRERRAQQLLWWALLGSAAATVLTFGLTAAGLRGVGALDALNPSVMGAVLGTRFSRIIAARVVFLALGFVALALLTLGQDRAVRSRWWLALAGVAGGGVLVTHALLGHASSEGLLARVAVLVHLVGVAVWLGGLVFLAVVVLPRRRSDEVRVLLPRFSSLAFTAVSAMVVAGAVMVTRVVPRLSALPQTGYGRMLLLKLAFVALLLVAAQQARTFTERKLVKDSTRLRPLLTAVGVELTLAVVILSSTAVLVGRVPPSSRTSSIATPSVTAPKGPR
jgi:putative copper export protein/methionine-rich copper-binding protein CopC